MNGPSHRNLLVAAVGLVLTATAWPLPGQGGLRKPMALHISEGTHDRFFLANNRPYRLGTYGKRRFPFFLG